MVRKTNKKRSEFLIYELLIIVSIIGMIIGIGIIYKSHLDDISVDSTRAKKVKEIASSLEKYYILNQSYPSCNQMSGSVNKVLDILVDINADSLANENSEMIILSKCKQINNSDNSNKVSYIGDKLCVKDLSKPCTSFTLKYYQQSTGKMITLNSENR